MNEKYLNKYRIPSARLQTWDYANDGAYFITICTMDRRHFFGQVKNGEMILTNAGVIADILWHEIKHHNINIELGEFIVMPNHIHGILILDGNNAGPEVQTTHALSLSAPHNPNHTADIPKSPGQLRFQNQGKNSISSIVGGYKSAVTKHCNKLGIEFRWQTRFYDNIIRDDRAFETISNYIAKNATKWEIDKFHSKKS
ncbi:transposase [Pedobacter sp. Leaf41]|uniref:transposase n=1 Tax=Pedobacter sp. Leaf41 TaxID=1736218 RepID=UPI000702B58E|nr:transposase [Pedobacter sp. Leaf41]KQN32613.1 transposase [Pedobacter sp. Leaf41]